MSLDAMRWAFQQTGLRSSVKFVLVALADRANDDGECWPSRDVIAADTCLNPETVSKATEELVALGLLEKHRRFANSVVFKLVGIEPRHPSAGNPAKGKNPIKGKTRQPSAGNPAPNLPINLSLSSNEDRGRFRAPSVAEVTAYCEAEGHTINPAAFVAYYESNGWKVGRNPMKSWHHAVAGWQARDAGKKPKQQPTGSTRGRSLAEDLTDRSWAG